MVEILVAMAILVIAFGLITVLYTRASRVRKVIAIQNDIQDVLTRMTNTIAYRDKQNTLKSLECATRIYQHPTNPKFFNFGEVKHALIFGNVYEAMVQYYVIAPGGSTPERDGTETTLWYAEASGGTEPDTAASCSSLDFSRVMSLESGSKFEYYSPKNTLLDMVYPDTTTMVKITLKGKSTDPSMKNSPAVTLQTAIRLKNKPSF